ncbi:OFA family MFS transporter [Rhodopila sp.]|uniref:OFA family MFS transporter n=1 Tax=Rhodopila sp. TaxID=2480087 RepID=UPI003D0A7589
MTGNSFLSRDNIVAGARFNRWPVPPAALAIHLSIGMAYGFSVFWLPMTHLIANHDPASCTGQGFGTELFTQTCNWTVPAVTPVFEIFIAVLGLSAAIWGGWLERAGPRKAGLIAALCWGGGLMLLGVSVSLHQLWLVYLAAVVCGIGQGLGYITPVSTLINWFPDRRGLATGLAIMGYGGGAMIGAPLAVWLIARFSANAIPGVAPALIVLGVIYFTFMAGGALGVRVPPARWQPTGWTPPATGASDAMITPANVLVDTAWRTPQFWLIWGVLCLNVTAGIGVISMASPMLQDVFGAKLVGVHTTAALSAGQKAAIVAAAAGLVGLISLFNALGRIFWASLSDKIGRKAMYYAIFVIGIVVYGLLPTWGHLGLPILFVLSICIILSMYGGGFSTVPAYLADIFGTEMVGAIHGRLITAWSVAGVVGPALIAGLRQFQLDRGMAPSMVYDNTLYVMAFLLFCGLLCNYFVKPVDAKYHANNLDTRSGEERGLAGAQSVARGSLGLVGVLAWLAVGVPFLIGLSIACTKVAALV